MFIFLRFTPNIQTDLQRIIFPTPFRNNRLWIEYRIGLTLALINTKLNMIRNILSLISWTAPIKREPWRTAHGNQNMLKATITLKTTFVIRFRDLVNICPSSRCTGRQQRHHRCLMTSSEVRRIIAIGITYEAMRSIKAITLKLSLSTRNLKQSGAIDFPSNLFGIFAIINTTGRQHTTATNQISRRRIRIFVFIEAPLCFQGWTIA